jgi:predicted RNA-binding protein with PUA-like domain
VRGRSEVRNPKSEIVGPERSEEGMAMSGKWLLKTEPGEYSYEDLVRDGRAVWSGVKNPVALKHLGAVRRGDACLIYHTGSERAAVGLARAVSDPYPDPDAPKLTVIDVQPVRKLPRPVTLAEIKADRRFAGWDLVRLPRLSVMPVPDDSWKAIMELAGEGR